MTEYLKWAVPGAAGLLILGVLIGAKSLGSKPDEVARVRIVKSYPAPEISVAARPATDATLVEAVSQSSTFYSSHNEFGRPRKHSHSRRHHSSKRSRDGVGTVDQEMGYISASDPKLIEAEARAAKHETSGWKNWVDPGQPNGR